jgi:surfactin synthase thioesterase subunit
MTATAGTARSTGSWIRSYSPSPDSEKVRLFCFPHAGGGGGAFRGWLTDLPAGIGLYSITLPGREDRIVEPARTDLDEIVEEIRAAIAPLLDRPFCIFGHSLGALIGAEVALALYRSTGRQPVHLFVSGCHPLSEVADPRNRHLWPDDDLLTLLRDLNGTPAELLDDLEFVQMVLPPFRADLGLIANYRYRGRAALDMPVTALGGEDDPTVAPADMAGWSEITRGPSAVSSFPGDHFYLRKVQPALVGLISAHLTRSS